MNRRSFFRTLFGTIAALPIARLFGWPDPPTVGAGTLSWSDMIKAAMVSSLTDWDSGYVEVGRYTEVSSVTTTNAPQGAWTVVNGPEGMYIAAVDAAAIGNDQMTIIAWGSDGRRVITYDQGLTWTELDTAD